MSQRGVRLVTARCSPVIYRFFSVGDETLMTEKKKRQKVVAEITVAHLIEFASEFGRNMTEDEAIAFLNKEGRAYEMWKHMMLAGEEYLKAALERQSPYALRSSNGQRRMVV